jgi:polysaccharide pyruvyl transferase WcaK-like protein
MKKILVLNEGGDFSNWGIQAATDGIVKILNEKIEGVELNYLPHSVFQNNYEYDPVFFGKRLFNRNSRVASYLFKEYIPIPKVADEFEWFSDLWLKKKSTKTVLKIIELIKKSDVVVYNAEGSTYRNNRTALRALFILWLAESKMGKKSYFLNGSVTITTVDPIIPAFINKTFSTISGVSVREPISKKNILEYFPSLEKKVQVIPDSAFSVSVKDLGISEKVEKLDLRTDYFCFSTSMLPIDYKESKMNSSIVNLLSEMKNKVGNIFILAKDIEDQFLKNVAIKIGAIFIGPDYSYQDVIYILSKSKFLFSGRYHHLIFATKVGVPVIPMNTTSHKIIGLHELFPNIMPYPIDPTNLWVEKDKVLEYMLDILEKRVCGDEYKKIATQYENSVIEHANIIIESMSN